MPHKFHMIHLSQTFLNSSIPPNDEILHMKGYRFIRADDLSNSKKSVWASIVKNS